MSYKQIVDERNPWEGDHEKDSPEGANDGGTLPGAPTPGRPAPTDARSAANDAKTLANPPVSFISRASVNPGRELNGRSQQILSWFDAAGPVGPSSRASAF
jgi:hypothetical protein